MKNIKLVYKALLMFYPRRYRNAFGAQMMQTFIDHYQDVERLEGRAGWTFWLPAIADEIRNITRQQVTSLTEGSPFLQVTVSKLAVSAVFFIPLYAVFYAALIQASLALPHPHVSGIGVLIALGALLLLPGIFSLAAGYVLASALVSIFPKRKVRSA